jgi:hypothetical protein
MNMYAIYLNIWKFGRDRSRNEIWTKTACLGILPFFEIFPKKSQILRFGSDLAEVWIIQIFRCLNIWTEKRIMAVTHWYCTIPWQQHDNRRMQSVWYYLVPYIYSMVPTVVLTEVCYNCSKFFHLISKYVCKFWACHRISSGIIIFVRIPYECGFSKR